MSEVPETSPAPTLASLRRRGAPRRTSSPPLDLFPGLFDLTADAEIAPRNASPAINSSAAASGMAVQTQPPAQAISLETSPTTKTPPTGLEATQTLVRDPLAERRSLPSSSNYLQNLPEPVPPTKVPSQTWTVSSLLSHVRGLVEGGYGKVTVEGEISNWRPAGSGHCYFTIKDAGAQLSAVLFRRQASLLRFRPADGDAVRFHGQLSIYESRGQMQLIVEWMEQVGLGALLAQVQRLKEQLRREGLFDRKRPLPPFPRCIGVITSPHGAALRDIIKVCRRRHAAIQLLIYPAAVQGPNCPAEIAAGLRWFSAHTDHAEVVLVARGGGSWEDLHGFDHEMVARAIAACPLPVVTGIGHAPDSTIADAAADLCAPTPSAAAEILTAAQHRVEEQVTRLHARMLRAGSFQLLRSQQRLARLGAAAVLRRVEDSLNRRAQRLDELQFRAETALRARLRRTDARMTLAVAHLNRQNPSQRLRDNGRRLELLRSRLERASTQRFSALHRRAETADSRLSALSPLRVLERGYALVYGPDGHLLRDAAETIPGAEIIARLGSGSLRAQVTGAISKT